MKFIDEVVISVQAGHGGAGARHFRREKFVPYGGPDGGNGGEGGSVVVLADRNKHTLLDFQFQPAWKAADGQPGGGSLCDGKCGQDLLIKVPVGTEIWNTADDTLVADLAEEGARIVIAKGGRGGKGNTFFKSPTNRAPEHAQPGEEGGVGSYRLSLKLVADVGLVGFPNAGKSTLISRISRARPKIADYPFTTLTPNLGVVQTRSGGSFVIADIPGLIPGAHEGKGLGIQFLKHIERTRLIAHLIDPMQYDAETGELLPPTEAFSKINAELCAFSELLARKQQLIVFTKMDCIADREELQTTMEQFKSQGYQVVAISSVTGEGLQDLLNLLEEYVNKDSQPPAE